MKFKAAIALRGPLGGRASDIKSKLTASANLQWNCITKISFQNKIIKFLVNPVEQYLPWGHVDSRRVSTVGRHVLPQRDLVSFWATYSSMFSFVGKKKKSHKNVPPVDGPLVSLQSVFEYSPYRPSTNCQTVLISSGKINSAHASLVAPALWVSRRGPGR